MKLIKYLFILALIIGEHNAYSQTGLYLKPYIGAGMSDWGGYPFKKSPFGNRGKGLSGGVELGHASRRWHKSIGVNLLRVGIAGQTTFVNLNNTSVQSEKFTAAHQHILVPVKFGYEIDLGKISLIPEIGVAPAYLTASTIAVTDAETHEVKRDKLIFSGTGVRRFSLFGIAGINLAYNINNHVTITVAPTYYLMLSNNLTRGGSFFNYVGSTHQYALTVNAGAVLKL